MAYKGNKFLFNSVIPDSPVLPEEQTPKLTAEEQMQVLEDRLQEYSEGWNPEYQLTYEKTQENGKDGYNIHLPYGVDFRIEHGNITFSKFGLSKDELKHVYAYLNQLGISGLSFDPNERDAAFEQAAKEAKQELKNEDGFYEMSSVEAQENTSNLPQAANSNIPQVDTTGMSDEEAIKARRNMAKEIRKNIYATPKEDKKTEEEHPCLADIERYMSGHIRATQKDKSNNYRKIATGNGYKLMWYKDADQKREGPKADKTGKVSPNFDAGLRADIIRVDGKPYLSVSVLTPKYGDAPDWVFDEAMNLAAECKSTHVRFKATAAFKGKFLNACAKKMLVPTGVKLKEKEFNAMMKIVKENNDDPSKRAEFYTRFLEQLENDLIRSGDNKNPDHPYNRMIKSLRVQIAVESSEDKFKRFNNFYEKNVQGKIYPDNSDVAVDLYEMKDTKQGVNAAKEMASGLAYVDLLAQYIKNPSMKDMSDEEMQKRYLDAYNKNLYLTHKNLSKKLAGVTASKDVKEILNREYQQVQKKINSIRAAVSYDGFDKLTLPQMDKYTYYDVAASEQNMKNRLLKGRDIYKKENIQTPLPYEYDGSRN